MKCGACACSARKLQRAIILSGPATLKRGRVCAGCARTGWLLVLGTADSERRIAKRAAKRAAAREPRGVLSSHAEEYVAKLCSCGHARHRHAMLHGQCSECGCKSYD